MKKWFENLVKTYLLIALQQLVVDLIKNIDYEVTRLGSFTDTNSQEKRKAYKVAREILVLIRSSLY